MKLPIVASPDTVAYLYNALPQCVILANGGRSWCDERFVNVYGAWRPGESPYVDFSDAFAYREFLQVEKLTCSSVANIGDISEFVRSCVHAGTYLDIMIDDYYLRGLEGTRVHDVLVYGVDDDTQELAVVGFDQNNMFGSFVVSVRAFEAAFLRAVKYLNGGVSNPRITHQMQMLAPRERKPAIDPGPKPLLAQLESYLKSNSNEVDGLDRTGWWWWIDAVVDQTEALVTGLQVHEAIIQHLDLVLSSRTSGATKLDYRSLHVLHEQKVAITKRLERAAVLPDADLSQALLTAASAYREIASSYKDLRLRALEYHYTGNSSVLTPLPPAMLRSVELERATLTVLLDAR